MRKATETEIARADSLGDGLRMLREGWLHKRVSPGTLSLLRAAGEALTIAISGSDSDERRSALLDVYSSIRVTADEVARANKDAAFRIINVLSEFADDKRATMLSVDVAKLLERFSPLISTPAPWATFQVLLEGLAESTEPRLARSQDETSLGEDQDELTESPKDPFVASVIKWETAQREATSDRERELLRAIGPFFSEARWLVEGSPNAVETERLRRGLSVLGNALLERAASMNGSPVYGS